MARVMACRPVLHQAITRTDADWMCIGHNLLFDFNQSKGWKIDSRMCSKMLFAIYNSPQCVKRLRFLLKAWHLLLSNYKHFYWIQKEFSIVNVFIVWHLFLHSSRVNYTRLYRPWPALSFLSSCVHYVTSSIVVVVILFPTEYKQWGQNTWVTL